MQELNQFFEGDRNVAIIGDFNTVPDTTVYRAGANLLGHPMFPKKPTFNMVVYDGSYGNCVKKAETLFPSYDTFVSDHRPVRFELSPNT